MKKVFILLLLVSLIGCGSNTEKLNVLEEEITGLTNENTDLKNQLEDSKKQLDEIKFGPEKLLSEAKVIYESGNIKELKLIETTITEKHPASNEKKDIIALVVQLEAKIVEEKEKADLELKKKEDAEKKAQEVAVASLRKTFDEVTGTTYYEDKTSPKYINDNGFYAIISKNKDGVPILLVRFLYTGDDWVFINKYIFKADDSTFEVTPSYGEVAKDNDYGEVWEHYTAVVDKNMYEIIQAVISSKKTIIRSQGDEKRDDRTVTSAEIKALRNVLDAFKAMGGNDIQFTL